MIMVYSEVRRVLQVHSTFYYLFAPLLIFLFHKNILTSKGLLMLEYRIPFTLNNNYSTIDLYRITYYTHTEYRVLVPGTEVFGVRSKFTGSRQQGNSAMQMTLKQLFCITNRHLMEGCRCFLCTR